ncbi:MAG TPA: phage/plasmid primase, P4 family, partial [Phycisphaerales bacterium]|nr:phage/plasmid primase, P4 family [Phycisphaerales bacterium]
RITSCDYDPEAKAPLWEACLERWQPSADVRAFLQRHAGYSLTGLTVEQTAVLHYGEGKNGKSKFTGAIRHVFGTYAGVVDHAALSDAKRGAGQANPEIARLVGLRFVLGSEIQQGVAFNEALIKDITGGDRVIARMLHSNPIEFDPQFALWLYGNHKPRIKSQDEGIWRRLPLVPWNVVIPPAERDAELDFKLKAESPGILAWMVRGCQAWQQEGLNPPAEVIEASAKYRRDEDHFGQFAEAHLVFVEGAMTPSHDIRKAYEEWCDAEGFKPWSTKALGDSIARLGGRSDSKKVLGVQTRVWLGVALASDRDDDEAPPEPADLEMAAPGVESAALSAAGAPRTVAAPAPPSKPAAEEADPFGEAADIEARTPIATQAPSRDPSALDVWVRRQFALPWRTDEDRGVTVVRARNLDELLERGEERGYGRQEVMSAANRYANRAVPADRAWWNQLRAQPRHPRVADTPESRDPSTSSDNPEDWDDIEDPFAEE